MQLDDESEVAGDLTRTVRTALMAGMQAQERAERQRQERVRESQGQESQTFAREQRLSSVLRQETHQDDLWKAAPNRRLAEMVTASQALSERHPDARYAFESLNDQLRDRYGVNIAQINRDHPSSAADRHQALVHALDERRQGHRDAAIADQQEADVDRDVAAVVDGIEGDAEAESQMNTGREGDEIRQEAENAAAGHEQRAEQYGAEVGVDARNTAQAERRSLDDAHADLSAAKGAGKRAEYQAVSDRATPAMKTAAQSHPKDVRAVLNEGKGSTQGSRPKNVRDLSPAQGRGAEQSRGR